MHFLNFKFFVLLCILLEIVISVGFSSNIYFFFIFFLILYIFLNSINSDFYYESKLNLNLFKNQVKFSIFTITNISFLKNIIINYIFFMENNLFALSYYIANKLYYKYSIINKLSLFI